MAESLEIIAYDGHFRKLAKAAEQELIRLETEKKALEKQSAQIREKIAAAIEASGGAPYGATLKGDNVTITYVPEGTRSCFDVESFAVEFPDLYRQYLSSKPVKASVRILVRKPKDE